MRQVLVLFAFIYLAQCQKLLNTTNWSKVLMVAAHPDDIEGTVVLILVKLKL